MFAGDGGVVVFAMKPSTGAPRWETHGARNPSSVVRSSSVNAGAYRSTAVVVMDIEAPPGS